MRFVQQLVAQLQVVWQGMSVPGRFGLIVLTLCCVAAIVGVGMWAAQPDYRVLYSGLSAEDAGSITAKLEAKNIPFRLTAGGSTIQVPASCVQQVRLDLAVSGLPSAGAKGFEMLDGSPLGMTPFMQQVNFNRALQSELAKTIMQLEPVATARVHVVRPDPTPFVRDQKPTTASVALKLKPGSTLSRSEAAGIVALVAGSVEGLSPEGVTLLDQTGRIISEQHSHESGAIASSQLEYRRQVESYLGSKAEEMLAQVLGPGRAIVRVTTEINFKRAKHTKEEYDPEGRVITRESVTNKKTTATNTGRGVAGAASNLGKQPTDTSSTGTGTQEETTQSDYMVSKSIEEQEEEVGNIQRINVAAIVQLTKAEADDSGATVGAMTILDAEDIIKRAVGFKQGRDEIKVSDVKLAGPDTGTALEGEWIQSRRWESYVGIARNASLGIAALVALLLGRMILNRIPQATQPRSAGVGLASDRPSVLEELSSQAERDPEAIARLLAAWVEDSETRRKAAA